MDLGTVQSVALNLFISLQSFDSLSKYHKYSYGLELEELQRTVSTIYAVFREAEAKEDLTNEAQDWIQELKNAVFEVNDVLDEFVTLVQKQEQEFCGSLSKKVTQFRRLNKSSGRLKDITKKFHEIATKHRQFGFDIDYVRPRMTRPETFSYVNESFIIGREADLESVVGTLLASNDQHAVSFLTIVGMGGLGKTALAQLVHNDPRVVSAFPLRLWTRVADQHQQDLKAILGKFMGQNQEGSTMDHVQSQVRRQLEGKRFLFVLDDLWIEDRQQLYKFVDFFSMVGRRSWIMVTTRSQETATIIGGSMYELQGLSEDNSWRLFEKMAFGSDQSNPPDELVKIGKEIVDRCAGVPLAIRVAGSLLFGEEKSKWKAVHKIGLANIKRSRTDIMPILILSFTHLETPLRSCFNYCAIFPKDFEIDKEMLLSLWMAQGYVVPLDEGESIEDVAEEYFSILLRRCFFQDTKKDKYGEIVSCRIHNLMHEVACYFTDNEMCIVDTVGDNVLDERIRHVSLVGGEGYSSFSMDKTNIYSFLHVGFNGFRVSTVQKSVVQSLIEKSTFLRALDLSGLVIDSFPGSIGKLYHLRYLNLSGNTKLEVLPKSVTELINLQTLKLRKCDALKALPNDLGKLVNLMELDIRRCSSLTCMSRGMGKLARLHRLDDFIVGGQGSYLSWNQWFGGLEDLKTLRNLKGRLNIQIRWPKIDSRVVKEDSARKDSHMSSNNLNAMVILFRIEVGGGRADNEGAVSLMDELQPHPSLKYLEVKKYHGVRMPGWITLLSNLVELHFANCGELEYLPCLRYLHHLRVLKLITLANLEYIGEDRPSTDSSSMHMSRLASFEGSSDYPSLETLELSSLPKFKGWRRGGEDDHHHQLLHADSNKGQMQLLPHFSQLKSLFIWNCPQMTCIPPCPMMEDLKLINFNRRLSIIDSTEGGEKLSDVPSSSASASSSCTDTDILKSWSSRRGYIQHGMANIKKVAISNVAWLNSLPVEALQRIESLNIWCDKEVESLGEVERVLHSCSSSLRFLIIHNCSNLRSVVSGGLEHLTALEGLKLRNCHNLMMSEEEKEGDESIDIGTVPWSSLHHSLRTLTLQGLPQLVNLPNWIQFLPALESLNISFCNRLKSMPAWMPKLVCLRKLNVHGCSKKFNRRCQQDLPGEDWPSIQQIPHISISASRF